MKVNKSSALSKAQREIRGLQEEVSYLSAEMDTNDIWREDTNRDIRILKKDLDMYKRMFFKLQGKVYALIATALATLVIIGLIVIVAVS